MIVSQELDLHSAVLSRMSRKELEYIKSMIPPDSTIPTPRVLENDTYAIEELREYTQMVSDEF